METGRFYVAANLLMEICRKTESQYEDLHQGCIITELTVHITRPGKTPQACNYFNYPKLDYTLARYFSCLSYLKLKLWCWRKQFSYRLCKNFAEFSPQSSGSPSLKWAKTVSRSKVLNNFFFCNFLQDPVNILENIKSGMAVRLAQNWGIGPFLPWQHKDALHRRLYSAGRSCARSALGVNAENVSSPAELSGHLQQL